MNHDLISTQAAALLWQRAARLQAASIRQIEEQAQQRLADEVRAQGAEGLSLSQVKAIAAESGIAPEFIQLALAETTLSEPDQPLSPGLNSLATQLLGNAESVLTVGRVIPAPLSEVYGAIQWVFPSAQYGLTLHDLVGEVTAAQLGLVFEVPPLGAQGYSYESFSYSMAYIEVKQLFVSLRALEPDACEIMISGQLAKSRWNNLLGSGVVSGIGSGLGALAGGVIGLKALAVAGGLLFLPAGLGALALGTASVWAYRAAYQWGFQKSRTALEKMLHSLEVHIRTQGAFPLPPARTSGATSNENFD